MSTPQAIPESLRTLYESDPQQFKKVMLALRRKVRQPHAGQQIVLNSTARFRVMNCGRRWGKTVLAAKIIVAASRKPDQMLWWVAPIYRITKRGYDEVLRQLPDGVLAKPAPPSSNFDAGRPVILHFKNGTRMEFYSAERPEGMLGAAVDLVVMDEAARMPAHVWEQTINPTLIDHLGKALMISTPRGRNWFYRVWMKGQGDDPLWDSWTFTTQDNPTLPPGEADRMAEDMPRLEADQEIYAKFLAAGSSVFLLEDRAIQSNPIIDSGLVVQELEDSHVPLVRGHVVLGIDLARTNDYTVMVGCNVRDRRNCFYERFQDVAWSEQRRRIARAVRTLKTNGATGITLCVDEGNAGSVIVEDLEEAGYDVVGVNFTTHKANMVRLLANDLERGRAYVLDTKLDEFESYQMNMTAAGRMTYSAPEGEHDDVVSAKMLSHWGCVNEGVPDVHTLDATVAVPSADSDPWDDEDAADDGDEWADLIDTLDDPHDAAVAIGLPDTRRPPTPQELMLNPEVWF